MTENQNPTHRPYIYVASSWRNPLQPEVVRFLRDSGFEVYDFRNPTSHFNWSNIDPHWLQWTADEYIAALNHPLAEKGFAQDMAALNRCDVCVLVLPCGRSAHLELGYATGRGKSTIVLTRDGEEPELMAKMAGLVTTRLVEVARFIRKCEMGAIPEVNHD